jgi:DNA-binding transcriptional MerR regulator
MAIGELARESGLPTSTIRYWERVGVLPEPIRKSGQRRYSREALDRLAVLRLAQRCGFRLDEMRQLAAHSFQPGVAPSRGWQESARKKQSEIDDQMAQLVVMSQLVKRVAHCRCADWKACGRVAASVFAGSGE